MERLEYKVAAEDEGKSAGYLLRARLDLSAGLVRRLKTLPDGIMLDGERVFTNALPKKGQVLSALKDGGRQQDILPVKGPLDIAYEDGDLLIANKQAPLPVHPSRGHYDDTLANYLVYEMERRKEPFSFHAVNRLDSGTSGLMCVAKNAHFANRLSELLRDGGITRLYMAVCLGEIKEEDVTDEAICKNWDLYSKVASTSAGNEQVACKVIVMGNSTKSVSKYHIGSGVMQDTLDVDGAKAAFKSAGLKFDEVIPQSERDRIATVFINAGADAMGSIRGRRTTMKSDYLSSYQGIFAKAVINAIVGAMVGDTMILASAGYEHQGPLGANLVADIVKAD